MIRPSAATWFELLAAKDDALCIAEALASKRCAEFEAGAAVPPEPATAADRARLRERFHELERRYRAWWPAVAQPVPHLFPATVLARSLARIEAWAAGAAPEIETLTKAEADLLALARWQVLLASPGLDAEQRAALPGNGHLAAALFTCSRFGELRLPAELLAKPLGGDEAGLFAFGTPAAMAQLAEQVAALGGRRIAAPEWIAASDALARLDQQRTRCESSAAAARQHLAAQADRHRLAEAVAEARCGCWCLDQVSAVEERQALCRITGWTDQPAALRQTLADRGIRALLRFPAPPPALQAPLLLHNPWWAQPYEAFGRLLGMPGRNAADPSTVVALVFPLIFGYMFGDFGQGLILTALGMLGGGRWPLVKVFIPAGLSAAFFGLVFGSVFSLSGRLDPLWLDPLDQPLPVLLLPLLGGAVLLLGGLVLAGIEARWRGEFAAWLGREGGSVLLYCGLLVAIAAPAGLLLPTMIATGVLVLALACRQASGAAILAALASSVEKTAQLAINTISFVRVGAFAIAHAGLSAALVLLVEATGGGTAGLLVLVLGNVFVIALEALVVSVQTTRLVLFEFFTRFFVGSGRAFHPATPPAPTPTEVRHDV